MPKFNIEVYPVKSTEKKLTLSTSETYVDRDIEIDIKPVIIKAYNSNELDDYLVEENEDRIFEYNGDDTDKYKNGNLYLWKEFNYLCFTANEPNSAIALNKNGSPSWTGSYSLDGINWIEYIPGTTGDITLVNTGDKVYFKGRYTAANTSSSYLRFDMRRSIAASGNIMSLCSGDDYRTATIIPYNWMFYRLFDACTSLTTAPKLPATTLKDYCYNYMFSGCTSLTTAAQLPATTLADSCYNGMFFSCIRLTTVPQLQAITLASNCYQYMFYGCTKIKLSETQTGEYTIPYRIPKEGTGTNNSISLDNMFQNTGGTFKNTPTINTTYYLSNTNSVV